MVVDNNSSNQLLSTISTVTLDKPYQYGKTQVHKKVGPLMFNQLSSNLLRHTLTSRGSIIPN